MINDFLFAMAGYHLSGRGVLIHGSGMSQKEVGVGPTSSICMGNWYEVRFHIFSCVLAIP
jgi:hypothetical protein|uniref:Uncharacterized protein n=1 Tax=Picea sitchensis TaxID=3332 RepID=A0A6B9XS96_PICSI|nr:hypothetical protein Q903MT_gene3890 [Picea sitchensis]